MMANLTKGSNRCQLMVLPEHLSAAKKKAHVLRHGPFENAVTLRENYEVGLVCDTTKRARRFLAQHSSVFSLHAGISSP